MPALARKAIAIPVFVALPMIIINLILKHIQKMDIGFEWLILVIVGAILAVIIFDLLRIKKNIESS